MMPYATAASTHAPMIFSDSTRFRPSPPSPQSPPPAYTDPAYAPPLPPPAAPGFRPRVVSVPFQASHRAAFPLAAPASFLRSFSAPGFLSSDTFRTPQSPPPAPLRQFLRWPRSSQSEASSHRAA